MTYPAEIAYRRDRTLTPSARRVYEYLTTELDFTEVRPIKAYVHCEVAGIGKRHFLNALSTLVEVGYLVEHERDAQVRRFTLAWSVNPQRKRVG